MKLNTNEIVSTEEIGILNGQPVKLLKTSGGFVIGMGAKTRGAAPVALSAGSHRDVVIYNIETQYSNFEPAMMKSAEFSEKVVVEKHSHFLPSDLRKSGHDIYSIQKGPIVNFHITKRDVNLVSTKAQIQNQTLVLADLTIPKEFVSAMAAATAEKAVSCGATKVKIGSN